MKSVVVPFEEDANANDGYVYTTSPKLSSRLALARMETLILEATSMTGVRVLDAGCGDGFFTIRFYDRTKPASMVAVDAAKSGVAVGKSKSGDRDIRFLAADLQSSPFGDDSFDIVMLQGVLHHVDKPQEVIAEAFRIAPRVLMLEPNGNNPGLKVIEKLSSYHRAHRERSYTPRRLTRWIEQCGASVVHKKMGNFVPMFSPEPVARLMKWLEPIVERTPGLKDIGCAVVVLVGQRR